MLGSEKRGKREWRMRVEVSDRMLVVAGKASVVDNEANGFAF